MRLAVSAALVFSITLNGNRSPISDNRAGTSLLELFSLRISRGQNAMEITAHRFPRSTSSLIILLATAGSLAAALAAQVPSLPPTPKKSVVSVYHGVKVEDNYRWLENSDDPAVRAWSDAQNTRARAFLAALPGRQQIRDR